LFWLSDVGTVIPDHKRKETVNAKAFPLVVLP